MHQPFSIFNDKYKHWMIFKQFSGMQLVAEIWLKDF